MYQEKKDETGKRNFLEQQNETIARNERINDKKGRNERLERCVWTCREDPYFL